MVGRRLEDRTPRPARDGQRAGRLRCDTARRTMGHWKRGAGCQRAGDGARAAQRDGLDPEAHGRVPVVAGPARRRTSRAAGVSSWHQRRRVAPGVPDVADSCRSVVAGDRRDRPDPIRRALSPPAPHPRFRTVRLGCPSPFDSRRAVRRRRRAISDTAHHEQDVCGPSCSCRPADRVAGTISRTTRRRAPAGRARTRDRARGPARSGMAHPRWRARAGIFLPAAEPRRSREALRLSRISVRPVGGAAYARTAGARPLPLDRGVVGLTGKRPTGGWSQHDGPQRLAARSARDANPERAVARCAAPRDRLAGTSARRRRDGRPAGNGRPTV